MRLPKRALRSSLIEPKLRAINVASLCEAEAIVLERASMRRARDILVYVGLHSSPP